jgi:hypothetical protein
MSKEKGDFLSLINLLEISEPGSELRDICRQELDRVFSTPYEPLLLIS